MAKETVAVVKKPFSGAPDGEHHPKRFEVGDEAMGELAEVAIEQKWAERKSQAGLPLGNDKK